MRKYYEDLKKIEDFTSFDRSRLINYIHRQKAEVSALCKVEAKFWVELDYVIGHAKSVLSSLVFSKPSDEEVNSSVKTLLLLMQEKIPTVKNIWNQLSDKEYFYLRKDLKTFENIFSHASNMVQKKLFYFMPFPLFLQAWESMTVLYPLGEKACDAGMLVRKDYNIILARYLARGFSEQLIEIIDYLIWAQVVFSKALDSDKQKFREQIVSRLSDFIKTKSDFSADSSEYSGRSLILELHEVLTDINIKSKIQKLLDKMQEKTLSDRECLNIIASIFIDADKNPGYANVYRDLYIASEYIAAPVIKHIGDNSALYEDINRAKILEFYFMEVVRYMVDPEEDMEVCRLFEIMFYLKETAPSFIMHDDIIPLLENSKQIFENRMEQLAKTFNLIFDPKSADRFIEKAMQVYAGKK